MTTATNQKPKTKSQTNQDHLPVKVWQATHLMSQFGLEMMAIVFRRLSRCQNSAF